MKTSEIIGELEEVRRRVYRLRIRNKSIPWFRELMQAIEILIKGALAAVEHVTKVTK